MFLGKRQGRNLHHFLVNLLATLALFFAALLPKDATSQQNNQIPGSGFDAGGWVGFAIYGEESGFFLYCAALAVYENDAIIQFRLGGRDSFAVIVPVPQGTFGTEVSLFVDDLPELRTSVQFGDGTAYVDLSHIPNAMEVFQSGWYFTYEVGGFRQTFILRGTRVGLEAADDCARRYYLFRADQRAQGIAEAPGEPGELPKSESERSGGSGSGFVVGSGREVVTNAHVIDQCSKIEIDGVVSSVVGVSEDFDLALLRVPAPIGKVSAFFSPTPAMLNDDITVAGYPLAQVLRGLNITRGSVSSSAGPRGYDTVFQITAPVQPGNSGGPVVNRNGGIVGVVVGKLAPLQDSQIIPENVNFAIRGEVTKAFLAMYGIDTELGQSQELLSPSEIAEHLKNISVFVECLP